MLTAIEGEYANGKVKLNETPHGIKRSRVIVTFLPDGEQNGARSTGVDLYGIWKDRLAENADIDGLLQVIRDGWSNELEEMNG